MTQRILRGASIAAIFASHVGPRIMLAPPNEGGGGGGDDRDLGQLAKDLKTATDEVKTFAEKANTEIKNLGKVTDETKEAADKALVEMNGISARLGEVEQKLARRPGASGATEHKSAGEIVVESEEYKAASPRGTSFKGQFRVEVKAITSASATGASASTALVPADRQAGMVELPRRGLVVRDLLTPGRTVSASIEYAREKVFTNNAATVAENPSAPKPESNITFELVTTNVRTIAHWIPASKQILADAPQLQSVIDGRLRYGLAYREDEQLLLGDGTGTNLTGLMTLASVYSAPSGVTVKMPTKLDLLRLAMLQATLALYPATGTVLHPTDWADIELTKDAGGNYIWANPASLLGPTLWGLPVAQSLAMPQNNFLTGALRYAAQIFDREDADVLISTEDRDNFVKNMVTVLAEERLALAIYRPQAMVRGTFS
ncbi:phage major capsid protein [Aureimonas sp. AU12]|uniref:phage major capsid protein n=1 Tax=Aureimonas sp. AU12 TaxID=1638161 RepID=UPI0009E9234D|nr:phage major capsid protein [Aureimonas sp. AU12]